MSGCAIKQYNEQTNTRLRRMQWRDSVYTDCNNTVCNRSVSERERRPEKYMFVLDSGEVGLTRREAIPVCVFTRWTLLPPAELLPGCRIDCPCDTDSENALSDPRQRGTSL